eukprot:jgi/Orpsp1_1/1181974/evm.model.c7180000079356.1
MVSLNYIKNALLVISAFSLSVDSTYAIKTIRKCIRNGDIALTFDDGPSLQYTSKILDILDKYKVKATFFVNGNNTCNLKTNPTARNLIKREYNSGHIIASHTYSHPESITNLSNEKLASEINTLNDIIYDIIGVKPAFFRPPLGEITKQNEAVLEQCGITANILWNLDSEDWNVKYNSTQQYISALSKAKPSKNSFIALNHDIQKVTATKNLNIIIPYIKRRGYRFVTMDVCTGMKVYQSGNTKSKTTTKTTNTNTISNTNIINSNTNSNSNTNTNTNTVTTTTPNNNAASNINPINDPNSNININTNTNTNNNNNNNLIPTTDTTSNSADGGMELPNPKPLINDTLYTNLIVESDASKFATITLLVHITLFLLIYLFI